jgi:DNA invertase Pin-like site-specific DNA recombinase
VLHKIGLYIRVSTEEQASNPEGSIKSQEQRLRTHADFKNLENPFGEVTRVFVDRAKSGKDTNRPELQKLLAAVASRKITLVMVTELYRLSRSIKEFSQMWELMRLHGCGFLSLREHFDATTAAGELVMYTIANIEQFKRRQTSDHIAANFDAGDERGLFIGGSILFGLPKSRSLEWLVQRLVNTVRLCA